MLAAERLRLAREAEAGGAVEPTQEWSHREARFKCQLTGRVTLGTLLNLTEF